MEGPSVVPFASVDDTMDRTASGKSEIKNQDLKASQEARTACCTLRVGFHVILKPRKSTSTLLRLLWHDCIG